MTRATCPGPSLGQLERFPEMLHVAALEVKAASKKVG